MQSKQWIKRMLNEIAICWEESLCSRRFLVVAGNPPYDYYELFVQRSNLLHLTGVDTSLLADEFYARALKGTLSDDDITISNDRLINKLIPLSQSPNFLLRSYKIGQGRGNRIYVSFDAALGPFPSILLRRVGKPRSFPYL